MKKLRKILLNYSFRAFSILGIRQYLRFIFISVRHLPDILKTGNLVSIDKAMGTQPLKINYGGKSFIFDCPYGDEKIKDDSFAFGYIRELCIRNCYFRHHDKNILSKIHTVLDIGSNRGVFSLLASTRSKVISFEILPDLVGVIKHNMKLNDFNDTVDCAFVGDGGYLADKKKNALSMQDIFQKYNLDKIDFVKIDIEGSEFALFNNPSWLKNIKYLSMEVHPEYGDVGQIENTLTSFGFSYILADSLFMPIKSDELKISGFLYAWKNLDMVGKNVRSDQKMYQKQLSLVR